MSNNANESSSQENHNINNFDLKQKKDKKRKGQDCVRFSEGKNYNPMKQCE